MARLSKTITDRALARVKDLRRLPIVEVVWRDATSFHGWDTLDGARKDVPDEARTTGRLIRYDKGYVSLVQTVNTNGKLCENWVIPRPWVIRVRRIGRA